MTKEYLEELIAKHNGVKKYIREEINTSAAGLQNMLSKFDLLELSEDEKREKEYLRNEYLVEGKSYKEIAENLGVTIGQVNGKIFKYALNKPVEVIEEITKEYLETEFLVKGRTSKDIANELGVKHARISSAIHRFGLSGNKTEELPKHVTTELVTQVYIEEDLTREATAEKLGITINQLDYFLRQNNISGIKGSDHTRPSILSLTKEYLTEEYLVKRRTADNIAKEHNITDGQMEYMLERYELYGKKGLIKDLCNEDKFNIEDPIFCYYAGLIATDGYIDLKNGRVCLRMSNEGTEEILNNIAEYFEFTGTVKNYPKYKKGIKYGIQYDLTITSKRLIEVLGEMNVNGDHKTQTINFPHEFCNDDCAKMFVRGVVDGDGCIRTFKHSTGFAVVCDSEKFIVGMINYLNKRFNINMTLGEHKSTKNSKIYPSCNVYSKQPKEIVEWMYTGYPEYRLLDKYTKHESNKKRYDSLNNI